LVSGSFWGALLLGHSLVLLGLLGHSLLLLLLVLRQH
jgi:hypothetical protein